MEENIYLKDYLVSRVISIGKKVDGYDKVFYQTNEDLLDSYLEVDFYNKDVLSVLASGDQVLTARYLDARKVDSFDYNRLTLYYFYLRLWTIKYRGILYPDVLDGSNDWLKELLEEVVPENEFENIALSFYKRHLYDGTNLSKLFYDICFQPDGKVLFTEAKELEGCLSSEIDFYKLDLFSNCDIHNTYDIILISNILELAKGDSLKIDNASCNLSRILNKDGIVICSKLINRPLKLIELEKDIFSSNGFDFNETDSSYVYIKK